MKKGEWDLLSSEDQWKEFNIARNAALANAPPKKIYMPGQHTFTKKMGMDDVDVEVDIEYTHGSPGDRSNPPDPGEASVTAVRIVGDLAQIMNENGYYMEEVEAAVQADAEGRADDYGDYLYECEKDRRMGL